LQQLLIPVLVPLVLGCALPASVCLWGYCHCSLMPFWYSLHIQSFCLC